jgi:hypothetical protein
MNTKMKRIAIASLGGFAVLCVIASCSRHDDVAYVQQPAQVAAPMVAQGVAPIYAAPPAVVVQAAPAHDGFLTGMLMGHLMSGGGSSRVEHHYINSAPTPQRNVVQNVTKNVTINKTVNTTAAAPVVAPRPSYSAPAYSSTTSRAAYSGYTSRPSTSYSGSYSSRSSYSSSSYSSRSSFGGRR